MLWTGVMTRMRHWEETSKEEVKIANGKMEGKSLQVEGVEKAPEYPVSQVLTKEKEQTKEKKKSKAKGSFIKKMEEKESNQEFRDAGEMVHWRSINQEEN